MLDLLDCLMPACHEESAVTTPAVADVTFGAVIALAVRTPSGSGRAAEKARIRKSTLRALLVIRDLNDTGRIIACLHPATRG